MIFPVNSVARESCPYRPRTRCSRQRRLTVTRENGCVQTQNKGRDVRSNLLPLSCVALRLNSFAAAVLVGIAIAATPTTTTDNNNANGNANVESRSLGAASPHRNVVSALCIDDREQAIGSMRILFPMADVDFGQMLWSDGWDMPAKLRWDAATYSRLPSVLCFTMDYERTVRQMLDHFLVPTFRASLLCRDTPISRPRQRPDEASKLRMETPREMLTRLPARPCELGFTLLSQKRATHFGKSACAC